MTQYSPSSQILFLFLLTVVGVFLTALPLSCLTYTGVFVTHQEGVRWVVNQSDIYIYLCIYSRDAQASVRVQNLL